MGVSPIYIYIYSHFPLPRLWEKELGLRPLVGIFVSFHLGWFSTEPWLWEKGQTKNSGFDSWIALYHRDHPSHGSSLGMGCLRLGYRISPSNDLIQRSQLRSSKAHQYGCAINGGNMPRLFIRKTTMKFNSVMSWWPSLIVFWWVNTSFWSGHHQPIRLNAERYCNKSEADHPFFHCHKLGMLFMRRGRCPPGVSKCHGRHYSP